jgi:hypothetical protein
VESPPWGPLTVATQCDKLPTDSRLRVSIVGSTVSHAHPTASAPDRQALAHARRNQDAVGAAAALSCYAMALGAAGRGELQTGRADHSANI